MGSIVEDLDFPEISSHEIPITAFDSIKTFNSRNRNFRDFPFTMGEVFHNLNAVNRFPKSYFKKMKKIRRDCVEFREKYILPNVDEIEKRVSSDPSYFPYEIMKEGARYRFFTLVIPEGFGGPGYMTAHIGIMAEELAVGCAGFSTSLAINLAQIITALDPYLFAVYSHESIQAERRGEPIFWSGAVTEPNAGTDRLDKDFMNYTRADMVARKARGGYVLNGSKCFISNGSVSQRSAMSAALDPDDFRGSGCFFVVRTDSPGFSVGRIERKGGQKSSATSEQICQDVFVPNSHKINIDGLADYVTTLFLCASRGPVGAIGVGCGRRALESLVKWAAERKDGRGRLIDQQALQIKIGNMARDLTLARNAYIQSGIAFDEVLCRYISPWYVKMGLSMSPRFIMRTELFRRMVQSNISKAFIYMFMKQIFPEEKLMYIAGLANMAKVAGSSAGRRVAGEVMEIMGPEAADPKWGVDKAYRDARLTEIYEGTNQACAITTFKAMAGSFVETLKEN